jgi:hypothetical protein
MVPYIVGPAAGYKEIAGGNLTTLTNPANWAIGDVLLANCFQGDNVANTINTGAGWVKLFDVVVTGTIMRHTVCYCVAGASQAPLSITKAGGDVLGANVIAIRAADTSTPANIFEASSQQSNTALSLTVTASTITPVSPGTLVLFLGAFTNTDTSSTVSFGSYSGGDPGFAQITNDTSIGVGGRMGGIFTAAGLTADRSATGTRTATVTTAANVTGPSSGVLLSIKALVDGTPGATTKKSVKMRAKARAA